MGHDGTPARRGGNHACPRVVRHRARIIDGREALEIGLAARSAPRHAFADALQAVLDEMPANSSESLVAYKDLYRDVPSALVCETTDDCPFSDTAEGLAGFR